MRTRARSPSVRRMKLGAVLATFICWGLMAPAAALATSTSAYVTSEDGGLMHFGISAGGGLSSGVPVTGGSSNDGMAASPDGKSLYVADDGGGVLQFDIGAGGQLTPKSPASVAAGSGPYAIAVSPDGRSVYVASFDGNVWQFDVGAGGLLSPKSPASVAAGFLPEGIAVSPDGRSVYVTNSVDGTVSQFDVGAGGALTPKSPSTVSVADGAKGIAVSPDGKSVYVSSAASPAGSFVWQFDVGAGGLLTPKSPAKLTVAGSQEVSVSPDGRSVYVTGSNIISEFDVGEGGGLTPKSSPTIAAGTHPLGLAVSPDGTSVYAVNIGDGTVSQYDVGVGGALTAKSTPTVGSGAHSSFIAIAPDQGPRASFSVSVAPAGAQTLFDASSSSDPDGVVARYDWSFGDGTTLANGGSAPTHTYAMPGTYNVTLTVTDDGGCSLALVFTGQTAYCGSDPLASTTQTITVPAVAIAGLKVSPHKASLAGRLVKGHCVKQTAKNASSKRCRRAAKFEVSYKLNARATVTFQLERISPGRTVKGRCVRQTARNHKRMPCSRLVRAGASIIETGSSGSNRFTLSRRRLGPGTYELSATPAGGASTVAKLEIEP